MPVIREQDNGLWTVETPDGREMLGPVPHETAKEFLRFHLQNKIPPYPNDPYLDQLWSMARRARNAYFQSLVVGRWYSASRPESGPDAPPPSTSRDASPSPPPTSPSKPTT